MAPTTLFKSIETTLLKSSYSFEKRSFYTFLFPVCVFRSEEFCCSFSPQFLGRGWLATGWPAAGTRRHQHIPSPSSSSSSNPFIHSGLMASHSNSMARPWNCSGPFGTIGDRGRDPSARRTETISRLLAKLQLVALSELDLSSNRGRNEILNKSTLYIGD